MSVSCNTHGLYFQHEDRCPLCTAESENARLTAEVERLNGVSQTQQGFFNAAIDRAEKAEAEVERLTQELTHAKINLDESTQMKDARIAALEAERATWAARIIASRNALIQNDCNEGYHQLYMLDDGVESDPFKPWVDLEAIALLAPPQGAK